MNSRLTFATELAQKTGQLLLEYFHSANLQTNLKADRSVVTEADLAADRMVTQAILERYPGDVLLSEELQPRYTIPGTNGSTWIVDPLDGTTNFSLGLHFWGVLITRVAAGQPQETAMYFPLINEMFTAEKGEGAYLNEERIHARPPEVGRPTAFFSCCSRTHRRYQVDVPYKIRILGSAAYTWCSVARGVSLLGFEATPKIWDIAGGWLLVKEAGGVIGSLDGTQPFPLSGDIDYARQSFPTLAAATPDLDNSGRKQIRRR